MPEYLLYNAPADAGERPDRQGPVDVLVIGINKSRKEAADKNQKKTRETATPGTDDTHERLTVDGYRHKLTETKGLRDSGGPGGAAPGLASPPEEVG